MKKFSLAIATICICLCALPVLSADAPLVEVIIQDDAKLPPIQGWFNSDARVTKLNTVSGYKGQWIEREYRTAAGVFCHATWIDGEGAKGWNPKKVQGTNSDGILGEGATFKTIPIAGLTAEYETHPILGSSVAITLADGVLTIESKLATEKEITEIAETIIIKMQ